ncbi:RNA polymerase sigma-70 factor [Parabacteroides sp. 52]|uniref:RNA polymerase sigma-70 factor n=1 Tax=unclassified Parabacteroides TaxID=2649774 RepID=UPI0013D059FC|nr:MULTISPECIES: RNA polymerase sigma-70 factor [unclassified Parabacteroides]MDH6533699.1 RNA polymerase sigma-70 factor (ECF subfamily) [Parabacteroides sp. PM5-20]NDV54451.1 RNA polymerase sigma-70 factor [Parabacteroides sp. 52]
MLVNSFSEDALLDDLKGGNQDTFNRLFRYYYPRLVAYISSMIEEGIAEDIAQDVFLYIWENRDKLYIGKGFHSYLFQSAYTRCLDYIRKNQLSEKYQVKTYQDYLEQYGALLKEGSSVLEELYTKDFYQQLYELLDELPVQRREVFVLAYIKGLRAKEIADLKGIPQRTVESHIYLTLKFLKNKMSTKEFFLLCILLGITYPIHL